MDEFRKPKKVSREDFIKKSKFYNSIPFTKSEEDFLIEFNKKWNSYSDLESIYTKTEVYFNFDEYLGNVKLEIHKLDDDWYLITTQHYYESDIIDNYYICDEWEEVIGYLSSNRFKYIDYVDFK